MFRGNCKFVCHKCRTKFIAPNLEWGATVLTIPQPCPKCGSRHTRPTGLFGILNLPTYMFMWKNMD